MSTEPFIGELKIFGFNFAPKGHAFCAGQTMSIQQYTALFSLLGTRFGGNGSTTFMLPDMQGRVATGMGNGAGLPATTIGEKAGAASATMLSANMPAHVHTMSNVQVRLQASTVTADESAPQNLYPALASFSAYSDSPTANTFTGGTVVSGTSDISGSGMPFPIMNPYIVLNYCIALQGIFPTRN